MSALLFSYCNNFSGVKMKLNLIEFDLYQEALKYYLIDLS